MAGRIRSRTGKIAGLLLVVGLLGASGAVAARGSSSAGATQLNARVRSALLDLYALDSRLQAARGRVAFLELKAENLREERTITKRELGAARSTLHVSQKDLAVRLRDVYEHGGVDPLAVVFGASSIGRGFQRLDDLKRNADESRQVVAAAANARIRLTHARRSLSADARSLARSLAAAQTAERSLASSVTARSAYISSLRAEISRTQARVVVVRAHTAVQKSQKFQPVTPPAKSPAGGRKLVVSATCYILKGTTATGMPVQKGVVAVDPNVIPLGSKLYIPGYGNGVAADVGGGIKGAIIDLWYPSYAQCAQWGRRTVTITVF